MKHSKPRRFSPTRKSDPYSKPDYNPLHYACLLWVDYLRADNERDKEQFLFEAASTLTVYAPRGDEGEEVLAQVAQAIRRRGRARALRDGMVCYVEATEDRKFRLYRAE